jgi:hypothetical protein
MDTSMASFSSMDYPDSPKSQSGDFAMQKYLLLQSQHEELLQHMQDLCPAYSCTPATTVTSPSVSPTLAYSLSPSAGKHTSPSPPRSRNHHRSPGNLTHRSTIRTLPNALEPVLDEDLLVEMAADKQKLCDVNEGIKRALTELLNSEGVRKDRVMRTWIQSRLMDTERELRTGRRKRSD